MTDATITVLWTREAGGTTYINEAWRVVLSYPDTMDREVGGGATKRAAIAEGRRLAREYGAALDVRRKQY